MYSIQERREIASRIAKPSEIPTYRRLLKVSGSPYAGLIDTNERKWAVLLVSALLETYSEQEIIQATQSPSEPVKTAKTAAPVSIPPVPATVAVKKNGLRSRNTPASTGTIWTILSSGLRTLSTRMQSIWAAGCAKLKAVYTKAKRPPNS